MARTLLYQLFGLGKVPRRALPSLEQEGIVLLDEGIWSGALECRFSTSRARPFLERLDACGAP